MGNNNSQIRCCAAMRIAIVTALALVGLAANAADNEPVIGACDASSFQTVLHASPSRNDARAVWLNRQLVKWPGMETSGTFKLYHSLKGQIEAARNTRVTGAEGALTLDVFKGKGVSDTAARFKYLAEGVVLAVQEVDRTMLENLYKQQLLLVREATDGTVLDVTALQVAGALDDQYASAGNVSDLGVSVARLSTVFKLWAPTAQQVAVCTYDSGTTRAATIDSMHFDSATGIWSTRKDVDLSGKYYKYLVDVFVNGIGIVRNLVTDPYSISLTTDSQRSYIASLAAAKLKPAGWDHAIAPARVKAQTDMVVYELHVRDFSINDNTVSTAHRGKYAAFTETSSNGMKHLAALSRAGMTDIHLMPVYDFASVPEKGCSSSSPTGDAGSETQQATVKALAERDCFNWGYDPYHYSAPEGSYATDASDGARRIIEFRQMVMALHKAGLRVGMDVVYNHTFAAGQSEKSVLDRIVPGYYHRLNEKGEIEHSTCCENTATESLMMEKLMIDSAALWAREYKIDSFRFDLMGHQPRAAMERLQTRLNAATGRKVQLIGEGWNFGEVANGARFVQASQLSLNGSGIGTFSDRGRDAVRGGSASDASERLIARQGYINGLVYDPNSQAGTRPVSDLMRTSDMIKVGLAGSIRSYSLMTSNDETVELQAIDYNGQPAGYASSPDEVVNYIENHDNQTLFDINVFKLPLATSTEDRARVQMLGAAINAFSQGVAYFHAGIDTLRSKSLDRNSFNAGDWFNRIDWSYQENYYGTGVPPSDDNGKDYAIIKPLLANGSIKPTPKDIAFARDAFRDLLKIRASSTLFHLRSAADIKQRLRFYNTGSKQEPTVIAARLDGQGYSGAAFKHVAYFINVDKVAHDLTIAAEKGKRYQLHPVHSATGAADQRAATSTYNSATGTFSIPPRTAVVFIN